MDALYDDSDPILCGLSRLSKDGRATDDQRRLAVAALAEIQRLRAALPSTEAQKCIECHHRNVDREGVCKEQISPLNYRNITYCGHRCTFPVVAQGDQPVEKLETKQ